MKNKVLVKLSFPELDYNFDVFIPVNEVIWKLKRMIIKSVSDLTGGALNLEEEYALINKSTSFVYDNNSSVIETDIRNATELIILSIKNEDSNFVTTSIPTL